MIIKDLPRVFKKDIGIKHNNKDISYVKEDVIMNQELVRLKLDKLFNTSRYVFNIRVIIKTKSGKYDTKIISRTSDSIITIDDDEIKISDIVSLIIKDRY